MQIGLHPSFGHADHIVIRFVALDFRRYLQRSLDHNLCHFMALGLGCGPL